MHSAAWLMLIYYCMQVSYSSGSPALDDRNRFRKYFRNSPTSKIDVLTLRSTVNHFNWTKIAVITQEESLFTIVSIEKCIR